MSHIIMNALRRELKEKERMLKVKNKNKIENMKIC